MFNGFHVISGGYMGRGGVTEAKNKDTGKEMLKLIMTEDKQGLV